MLGKDPSEAFDTLLHTHTHTHLLYIYVFFVSPIPNNNKKKAASYSLLGCLVYVRQCSSILHVLCHLIFTAAL